MHEVFPDPPELEQIKVSVFYPITLISFKWTPLVNHITESASTNITKMEGIHQTYWIGLKEFNKSNQQVFVNVTSIKIKTDLTGKLTKTEEVYVILPSPFHT